MFLALLYRFKVCSRRKKEHDLCAFNCHNFHEVCLFKPWNLCFEFFSVQCYYVMTALYVRLSIKYCNFSFKFYIFNCRDISQPLKAEQQLHVPPSWTFESFAFYSQNIFMGLVQFSERPILFPKQQNVISNGEILYFL